MSRPLELLLNAPQEPWEDGRDQCHYKRLERCRSGDAFHSFPQLTLFLNLLLQGNPTSVTEEVWYKIPLWALPGYYQAKSSSRHSMMDSQELASSQSVKHLNIHSVPGTGLGICQGYDGEWGHSRAQRDHILNMYKDSKTSSAIWCVRALIKTCTQGTLEAQNSHLNLTKIENVWGVRYGGGKRRLVA